MGASVRFRRGCLRLATAVAVAAVVGAVHVLPGQPAEPSPAVFVPDSSKAADQFRLAERLEGQREWAKAADVYQEIVDRLGDRVMPAAGDGVSPGIARFETVARQVERRLARWPEAGLRVYRERFERAAAELAATDEPAAWSEAVDRYFVTDAALEAALKLVDHRLETGELAGAEVLIRRLLETHPSLDGATASPARRREVLVRGAVVAAGLGDAGTAEARLTRLEAAGGPVLLAGAEATAERVREEVERALAWSASGAADEVASWPMPGGTPSRSGVSSATARPTARVAVIELPEMPARRGGRPVNPAVLQQQRDHEERARRDGTAAVILPSADRGQLFFQDGSRLWGVSLESGLPLPGWVVTHGGSTPGVYTLPSPVAPVNSHQYSVTLTADSVLAVMGFADVRAQQWLGLEPTPSSSRLVRLERETGRVVWESLPRQWPEAFARYRQLDLFGSPVVVGANVYIAALGSNGNQFNDAYVVCLDLESGRPNWVTFVASAAGAMQMWMDGTAAWATVTHLAAEGGRVFFQTNLGAVAALDGVSGRPEWITTYPRESGGDRFGRQRTLRTSILPGAVRPWAYNPPIVRGGLVFTLPTDSRELLVLDAADGRIVQRLPMAEFDRADMLLHADDQRVIVGSESSLFALQWRRYRPPPLADGEDGPVLWRSELAGSAVRGRPFVTRTAIYVPTQARLLMIDPVGGKAMAAVPDYGRRWEGVEGQGHVLAVGDQLVIGGMGRVELHTDLTLAEMRYREAAAARPRSAEPRLRWAEVLFNAGRVDDAMSLLEEAATLLRGGDGGDPGDGPGDGPGGSRGRLYAASMSMGDALVRQAGVGPSGRAAGAGGAVAGAGPLTAAQSALLEKAGGFYRLSARAASSAAEQVEYRRRLAGVLGALGRADAAVDVWQEVLANAALRDVPVQEESGGFTTPAGRVARREVTELVRRFPSAYERFEREAARSFAEATSVPELLNVARHYPNARVAPEAMMRASELLQVQGEWRSAERVLRELFVTYAAYPRRGDVAEAMARVAAATPGRLGVVQARLAMGARLFPEHRLTGPLTDGHVPPRVLADAGVRFAEALSAVRTKRAVESAAMADVGLPDEVETERYRQTHRARIDAVRLMPSRDVPRVLSVVPTERARADAVVVQLAGGELGVVSPRQGLSWKVRSPGPATAGAAWVGTGATGGEDVSPAGGTAGLLLAWDDRSVAAYAAPPTATAGHREGQKAPAGVRLWRLETDTLPALEVARGLVEADDRGPANDNDNAGVVRVIRQGNQHIVIRGNAVFRANVLMNVRGAAVQRPPGEAIVRATLSGDRLVVATATGRVLCVSPADGSILWQTRATAALPERLLANEDFVVVVAVDEGGSQVVALDADSGTVLWRRTASDPARAPINAALSDDGMLVFTVADRLCGKDLSDPTETLTFETPSDPSAPFIGMSGPRQLVISDGLVLAVTDQEQFVRLYSLADHGRPLRYPQPGRDDARGNAAGGGGEPAVDAVLATRLRVTQQPAEPSAAVHVDGSRLYVVTSRSVVAYDLRDGREQWHQLAAEGDAPFAQLHLTRRHVLATTQPVAMPGEGGVRVLAMSRSDVNGRESGLRVHEFTLGGGRLLSGASGPANTPDAGGPREARPQDATADPAAGVPAGGGPAAEGPAARGAAVGAGAALVRHVQPVEGGLYFLTLDGVLRFAAGTAPHP